MLNQMRNMKFTTKMFTAMISVVIVSIVITSWNAIMMSTQGLYSLGEGAIENIHTSLYNSLDALDGSTRKKLESDLALFEKEIKAKGSLWLDEESVNEQNLTNQVTRESIKRPVPTLVTGETVLNNDSTIVDSIENITTSSATIFQLVDDKLLRIATTVKNTDGSRAVGTYIPSESPVYKAVLNGDTFLGKAFVVNDWYLTAYKPIIDRTDKIVGAIYVGQLMLSDQVKKLVSETKIGKGYFFVYSDEGAALIHPTLKPSDNVLELVPILKTAEDGLVEYEWKGEDKVTYKKHIDQWGVTLAVGLNRSDIVAGLDIKMLKSSVIVGIVVIVVAILITILMVRSINKILKDLASKAVKVGAGDYTVHFSSKVDDAIGQLTNSLGIMVSKGKEMLGDIIKSSESLAAASTELATVSDQMVTNAESTTAIADEASANAQEVSDNMTSVSAAMEQSTTNLDMIAAASEEMGTTIKDIAENSAKARLTTEKAVGNSKRSYESIKELGEAAKAIGSITETITEISEQTNLLALNATIEAARAGESGKGFAVVANEIKELAKGTAEATGQIREAIDGIQHKTSTTIKDIEEITSVINDINEIVTGIVTAVEEQSITTNEIVNNVTQASQGISDINENVANSSQMTIKMSDGVQKVKERSVEVKENSQHVSKSAEELSKLAEKLTLLVSKFKI